MRMACLIATSLFTFLSEINKTTDSMIPRQVLLSSTIFWDVTVCSPMFRRQVLPLSSGLKIKRRKYPVRSIQVKYFDDYFLIIHCLA